jgi:type IV pilus assembly protein PilM
MINFSKLLNPPKKIAGLDIGNAYIKAMEFEGETLEDAKLANYWIEPIPSNIHNDGKLNNVEALGKIIKNMWRKAGFTAKHVAIALPNSNIISKKVISPVFDEDAAMNIQMENLMREHLVSGVSMDDIKMDYAILGENKMNITESDIMLVGARNESIDERVAIVESAGLTPLILDVEQYAYQNMLRLIKGEEFVEKNYILLDCSANMMRMMIFQKGVFFNEETRLIGGNTLTNEVSSNVGLDFEEAERLKKNREGDDTYEIIEKTFLNNYVNEFMSMFQFLISSTSIDEIDEIILTGGTANIPGIENVFKHALQSNNETRIKSDPYVAKPLGEIIKSDKIDLVALEKEQASLFLVTSLAVRQFLRQY